MKMNWLGSALNGQQLQQQHSRVKLLGSNEERVTTTSYENYELGLPQ